MSKLAVILPYNEKHIKDFTEHFSAVVEQKGFYYKLYACLPIILLLGP